MEKKVHVIGAASHLGFKNPGSEESPEVVYDLIVNDVGCEYTEVRPRGAGDHYEELLSFSLDLAETVKTKTGYEDFPIVIGGDHSVAMGTWHGVKSALDESFGLIWVDAHLDAHTLESSPSGNWHGMPVASLLGYGDEQMANCLASSPVLMPQHLCVLGVREFEKEEIEFLSDLNVLVISDAKIKEIGFEEAYKKALKHVTKYAAQFGVSFDLDVIKPSDAPGVNTPVIGGITKQEAVELVQYFAQDPRLIGFEFVEFCPKRDCDGKTGKCLKELVEILL